MLTLLSTIITKKKIYGPWRIEWKIENSFMIWMVTGSTFILYKNYIVLLEYSLRLDFSFMFESFYL